MSALLKLIHDYGDACFDCGEWQKDTKTDVLYEEILAAQEKAKGELIERAAEIESELVAAKEEIARLRCDDIPTLIHENEKLVELLAACRMSRDQEVESLRNRIRNHRRRDEELQS